jgi:alpha-1,2-mannosyltransferase
MKNIVLLLRSGSFLTRERALLWATGLIAGLVLSIVYLGLTAHGLSDYAGRPLGTDFSNVYAAGVAAGAGDASAPFDAARQLEMERRIFGSATPFYGWHYPPFFLLLATPLAKLPYAAALILWQGLSLLFYLGAIKLLLRKSAAPSLAEDRLWLPLALGFTAVFVNLIHGQNGFLTTALFAAGLAVLDERPIVAGILFGLLCYKPQFAAVIPLVLAATGRWRVFAAGAATVAVLAGLVTALFGFDIWPAFMQSLHFTRTVVLEQGNTGFHKIQSVFALVRLWGGSISLAYLVQAAVALSVIAALIRIWRDPMDAGYKKAALCLAALLITPYCLDYDLVLLAPAIALLGTCGKARGFSDFEILSLAMLWSVPVVARNVAHASLVPLAVPAMLFCFLLIWRRRNARDRPEVAINAPQIASW